MHRCSRQLAVYAPQTFPQMFPQMPPLMEAEVSARCCASARRIAAAARRSPPAASRVQGTRGTCPERLHASSSSSSSSASSSPTSRKQQLRLLQLRTNQSLYSLIYMTSRNASRAAHTHAGPRQRPPVLKEAAFITVILGLGGGSRRSMRSKIKTENNSFHWAASSFCQFKPVKLY